MMRQNEIVLSSIALVAMIVLFNLAWSKSGPVAATAELQNRIEAAQKKLSENQLLMERVSKRSPSADGMNAEVMDQYVLRNDKVSSVITGIVENTKGKSFVVNKLALEEQVTEGGYRKMLYSLDADASFVDVGKFLEKLEDAPLLIEVNSIEINRIEAEMKQCKTKIKLYSYVRIE